MAVFAQLLDRWSLGLAKIERVLANRALWPAGCALVLLLQAALIIDHQPWPDEYQALLIAVQAPDLAAMLDWLRYEGHPPLWYFLLRGLAHLVEPLDALWIAALLIAIPAQCLILFASPFSRAERLMIGLSEFVLFDFFTISRGTTLGVALLILALVLWRRRRLCWLVIALLPQCDFLFGVISGILLLLQWREERPWWPGVALWLASGVAATWSVLPPADVVSAFDQLAMESGIGAWLAKLSALLIPFQGGIAPMWNSPVHPVWWIAWLGFLAFAWVQTRNDIFHRLLLFGFIGLTLAFSLAVYPLGLRHLMLIALLVILLTWLRRSSGEAQGAGFGLWLFVCALCGLGTSAIALTRPFDSAGAVVAEIDQRGLGNSHWMAFPDWRIPGFAALSGREFERPEQECMLSFVRWDYRTTLLDPERLEAYLREKMAQRGRFYLVSDLEITAVPPDVLEPLATIPAGYDGLAYYLYTVGPDLEEHPLALPPCVEGRKPLERLAL